MEIPYKYSGRKKPTRKKARFRFRLFLGYSGMIRDIKEETTMAQAIRNCFERYEKKYLLTPAEKDLLLGEMRPYLTADEYGKYTILNTYYDTDDFLLIRESLEKPVYKEKLRIRSYGVPARDGTVFAELKKKYCGVVYKRRITLRADEVEPFLSGRYPDGAFGQIGREIGWFQSFYHTTPKAFIGYDREAYAGTHDPELRITFDSCLRGRSENVILTAGDYGTPILPADRILMEIKLPGVCPLWLSSLLSKAKIFGTSFSKYGTFYQQVILPAKNPNIKKEAFLCA